MSNNCFKLYDTNLVDSATLTPSTTNALFPVANIQDQRRSKVYRSTTNSDNIIMDFASAQTVNGIFIVSDKRSGFGVTTVTVEFNTTNSWGSPAYSVAVPFSSTLGIGHVSFADISYRWARVVMTSTLGYCELSKIYIGKEVALTSTIGFGWTIKNEDTSKKVYNRYGQLFTDELPKQKSLSFAFKNITKDDLDLINLRLDQVGEAKPVYVALGDSTMAVDYRRFSGPLIFNDMPTVSNSSFNRFNLSLSGKELM